MLIKIVAQAMLIYTMSNLRQP